MGKRSNFERGEADFYPTPRAAVVPLIPYLRGSGLTTLAEPCAGAGALVGHMESFGFRCVHALGVDAPTSRTGLKPRSVDRRVTRVGTSTMAMVWTLGEPSLWLCSGAARD
jgi:hypothetical protein